MTTLATTARPPIKREQSSLLGTPGPSEIRILDPSECDGFNFVHTKFEGLEGQMSAVAKSLEGFIPHELIDREVTWFYTKLDIDYSYLANERVENIRSYIISLWSAKLASSARATHPNHSPPHNAVGNSGYQNLAFDRQYDDHAVFFDTSFPGQTEVNNYETIIDERYLAPSNTNSAFRVESFRRKETSPESGTLRAYFVGKCEFAHPNVDINETDLEKISDTTFLARASKHTKAVYSRLIERAVNRTGPVTEIYELENLEEARLLVAYRQGTAAGFFPALSDLYHYYDLTSSRKYVDQFANGITVVCVYLKPVVIDVNLGELPLAPSKFRVGTQPSFRQSVIQVHYETSLLYCVPQSTFSSELKKGRLSIQEVVYSHCAHTFVMQFVNRLGAEYERLSQILVHNSENASLLLQLKKRLRSTAFTAEYVAEILRDNIDFLKDLYLHFAARHYVAANIKLQTTSKHGDNLTQDVKGFFWSRNIEDISTTEQLRARISRITSEDTATVLNSVLTFNEHVLKTNFYTPTKVALSFRLDPSFLPKLEYPDPLFGMFLVVGQEFLGFHLRFRDVARGGIRIVKSRNKEAHSINARQVFDENYNLANTQQRKNKDIPEGGSKGVILLNADNQANADQSFHKYIDAIIDLLIPGNEPGIKEAILDYYGQEEILFMGPDENTAGLVDWATQHAKNRGAPWWKSFFTGKSPLVGGIPHDEYGMTSLSVREYVKGIYRKLGLEQKIVNKLQTGGPDGDLGSNEILLSTPNERYIAVVDGSGVLADANGIDKEELIRLAKERKMVSHFDKSKLSPEGYLVLIDDINITLPNGVLIDNGVVFRNMYHLQAAKMHKIDIFVPCGGRPGAINASNVRELIDEKLGKSLIPFIVEGANLFITQEAKLELENAGTIIYKDASANKGGVTSSSLEVLASLAFDDEEFFKNMCENETTRELPHFYRAYVAAVQNRIRLNADLEFEAIWRDAEVQGKAKSLLSDELSKAINTLGDDLSASNLWEDIPLRNGVLNKALPDVLVEKIGLPTILKNVPEAYLRAIFASYLAGRYIYSYGSNANQFAFYEYMTQTRTQYAA